MDNDTQVLDPAVIEPAVVDPAVIEPAATETIEPVVTEPVDPITGTNSQPGSASNTSNGNQVAVNSNFDYSTHNLNIYSYSSTTTTNQESLTTQMGQPSGSLQAVDGFNCGVTTTQLARSYRFDSREYFRGNGRRSRVDRIINFSGTEGDTLELSKRIFKGIGELDFVAVRNAKASKKAARTDNDIIYERSTGKLYFNSNDSDHGFGKQGGLFAIMEASPLISRNDFVLF